MRIIRSSISIYSYAGGIKLPYYLCAQESGTILGSIHDFELFLVVYNIYIDRGMYIEVRE
jgi:hypothetical protein